MSFGSSTFLDKCMQISHPYPLGLKDGLIVREFPEHFKVISIDQIKRRVLIEADGQRILSSIESMEHHLRS